MTKLDKHLCKDGEDIYNCFSVYFFFEVFFLGWGGWVWTDAFPGPAARTSKGCLRLETIEMRRYLRARSRRTRESGVTLLHSVSSTLALAWTAMALAHPPLLSTSALEWELLSFIC